MDIIHSYAKELRRELTTEERHLWYLLRSRRFSRYKFRRQHPIGNYIVDFACCEAHLVVELDGGQHDERAQYDRQRTAWLNAKGWEVIRFWNNELWSNEEAVLGQLLEVLQTLLPSPRPSP
jgi:very-short-patch-repair endonuclease